MTRIKHLQNLREHKKLTAYLMRRLPAIRDVDLMGAHADLPREVLLLHVIVVHQTRAVRESSGLASPVCVPLLHSRRVLAVTSG